ncbi:hypothetical protein P3X46_029533 [Hevea brasiliensis]|uniref:IST1-like protein n=1 Tax=Hevea brasiliensis TaxID=3981 RepID=A0ABQ9KTW3_HEVBR|nr:uncharacterized protein LOC110637875 [Hevea brasiliensis]KAJ9147359.1 hypothetical protein P3X46_029533 [Hevea brasiliensis]
MEALVDTFLGRKFKTSRFKILAKLAISRVAILRNQRQVRYSHAKSDVVELLNLGHQEQALLRVEHVIKEQNMMDTFAMIEDYCYLLIDRVMLLKKDKECHDDLKEAISSLIFASSRCGEFPELQKIRAIFVTRFGREFAACAVELRNNCGVNSKIMQKLSTRRPSLESRLKVLKDTAFENGIVLNLVEDASLVVEEKLDVNQKQKQQESYKSVKLQDTEPEDETHVLPEELIPGEQLSASLKARKKYRDVAAAALQAFESAADAAAAARAAVELSRSKSQDTDQDYHSGCSHGGTKHDLEDRKNLNNASIFEKIHPIDNTSSESEGEDHLKALSRSKNKPGLIGRTPYTLSSDSNRNTPSLKHQDLDSYIKPSFPTNEIQNIGQYKADGEEYSSDKDGSKTPYRSPKWILRKP